MAEMVRQALTRAEAAIQAATRDLQAAAGLVGHRLHAAPPVGPDEARDALSTADGLLASAATALDDRDRGAAPHHDALALLENIIEARPDNDAWRHLRDLPAAVVAAWLDGLADGQTLADADVDLPMNPAAE